MIEEVDKAYAAGFFDGEGWVGYRGHSKKSAPTVQVTIAQNDTCPLIWLQELWGGGGVFKNGNCNQWRIGSKPAVRFLEAIQPFLKVKGDTVQVVLEAYYADPRGRNRGR